MSKYHGRVDPIDLLRNCVMSNKKIKNKDKYLYFQKDMKLPITTGTAWLSPLTNKQYSLGSLWLYLQFGKTPEYIQKTSQMGLQMVNVADRSQIQSYFTGKTSQSQCINQQLKMQLIAKTAKRDQPVGGFQDEQQVKKNKQNQLPFDLRVIDYVSRIQRPIGSKNRSLRCATKTFDFFLKSLQEKQSQVTTQGKSRLNKIFQRKKYPIIIVPEFIQSGNLALNNVQKFLVRGEYQEAKQLQNTLQRKIQVQYSLRGKKIIFEVTNNPSLLSLSDWENVVAVFVSGRKNQFSSWSIRDPLQIFKKAKGFMIKYPNMQKSSDLNVKTFVLQRHARYRDEEVVKKIWNQLEDFLFEKST